MALTYTPSAELGSNCPDFHLPSVDGHHLERRQLIGKPVVVLFLCGHCPYVQAIEDRVIRLARDFQARGVNFVAICSNDPSEYPEDDPAALLERWQKKNYGFPYLIDAEQTAARAFGAVCTPDIFLYDREQTLRYRGRLDDSWRNPQGVHRQELREAIEAVLAGRAVDPQQNPAMGCSIKWKAAKT